jgi:hypothetical protein
VGEGRVTYRRVRDPLSGEGTRTETNLAELHSAIETWRPSVVRPSIGQVSTSDCAVLDMGLIDTRRAVSMGLVVAEN